MSVVQLILILAFVGGTLFGIVIAAQCMAFGLRHSSRARDQLREHLARIDGWPLAFCRNCASWVDTAPKPPGGDAP
jgi:hypothetical protein